MCSWTTNSYSPRATDRAARELPAAATGRRNDPLHVATVTPRRRRRFRLVGRASQAG